MKRFKRIVLFIVILLFVTAGYLLLFHSYHGETYTGATTKTNNQIFTYNDDNNNGVSNQEEIARNGVTLVGTLYDPLKGSIYNIGGKMGFIVCIDVPRIAYGQAGISLASLLKSDFEQNPEHYQTEGGINTPDTPFFYRRVRNVYSYAQGNGMLIEKATEPKVGDIVFYGKYHATLVVSVHEDGTYDEVEAHPQLIFVKKHEHKKWIPRDVARILK
jgi:uncharacterized protein YijF (DUF1287 family)